jgi:MscS family membrane protein
MINPRRRFFFILVLMLVAANRGYAAQSDAVEPDAISVVVEELSDPFERDTPRGAMNAFMHALEEDDFDLATRYMDLRYMPSQYRRVEGKELARMLDFVISRRLRVDLGGLSDEREGDLTDGFPRSREVLGVIEFGEEHIPLYLQRVRSEQGMQVWNMSSVTVAGIVDLYDKLEYPPVVKWFESNVPAGKLLGLEYFKWVIILLSMAVAYPFAYALGLLMTRILSRRGSPLRPRLRAFFTRPIAFLLIFIVGRWVLLDLGMGVSAMRIAKSNTSIVIVSTWVIISGINVFRDVLTIRLRKRERLAATVLMRPIANSLKGIVVLAAVLMWLDNIGFNISTLLAGLGVGGLALALALQKPLEDLFGAITIFTQQPIRAHDFCRFGTVVGTVEEIGLRSTRIRTLDDTLVTVPNARMASEYIENYSARSTIRYRAELCLLYNTTAGQLRKILAETVVLLEENTRLVVGETRARLKSLGKHGFEIEVIGHVETTEYVEYLEVAEKLNLGITQIVASAGAKFVSPISAGDGP